MYASGSTGASERSEALFVGLDSRSDRDDTTNKTASELEQMILARVRDEMVCPTDLQVRVIRVGGRWDAFAEVIDKESSSAGRFVPAKKTLETRGLSLAQQVHPPLRP